MVLILIIQLKQVCGTNVSENLEISIRISKFSEEFVQAESLRSSSVPNPSENLQISTRISKFSEDFV